MLNLKSFGTLTISVKVFNHYLNRGLIDKNYMQPLLWHNIIPLLID